MPTKKSGSLGDNYPAFHAFGCEPRVLSHEEAIAASPDERIASVWRFLVIRAAKFLATLKRQERSNFDVEDILMELYVTLRDKDGRWVPERGKYITYASKIADRALSGIRDRARTVESPRNSSCRMREYQEELDGGTITDRRAKTFDDIRRSSGEMSAVESDQVIDKNQPGSDVECREQDRVNRDAIIWGLMELTPFESACLGHTAGLWGRDQLTVGEIATRTGRTRDAVKKAKESGGDKIKKRLFEMCHPAIPSPN